MRAIYFLALLSVLFACSHSKKLPTLQVAFSSPEDEKMFIDVQRATFQYFWDGAEPNSGFTCERFPTDNVYPQNDKNVVASGGGGFGVIDHKRMVWEKIKLIHLLMMVNRYGINW